MLIGFRRSSVAVVPLAVVFAIGSSSAWAQVFNSGPDDPSLFTTVIDLPPTPDLGINQQIGGVIGETVQLNLLDGGNVGLNFALMAGAEMNVSGGNAIGVSANSGSEVNISGGGVEFLNALAGSEVNISGGNTGGIDASDGAVVNITGGSTEGFSVSFGATVNVTGGTIVDGGEASTDGIVHVSGGSLGNSFTAREGSEVKVSGGNFGLNFEAGFGSDVEISGGSVGSGFDARSGSEVNISGGSFGSNFRADSGSEVQITGGHFGSGFTIEADSAVEISGGSFGYGFFAWPGEVKLIGGEFRLNGNEYSEPTISFGFSSDETLTGTLADGSPFIFNSNDNFMRSDGLGRVQLIASPAPLPSADLTPRVLSSSDDQGPSGLRRGQTLTVRDDGALDDHFAVIEATLNVEGGSVGEGLEVSEGLVNISGGTVGTGLSVYSGGVVNISGGDLGSLLFGYSGSEINLFGTEFLLDGQPISGLSLGEVYTVNERGVDISGILSDGNAFDFIAGNRLINYFSFDMTLTVTLVPEPASWGLFALSAIGLLRRSRRLS